VHFIVVVTPVTCGVSVVFEPTLPVIVLSFGDNQTRDACATDRLSQ